MRSFSATTAIALSILLFVSICSAQQASTTAIPNLIRYSGTLKDAQGAVPSAMIVGVTFAIYKEQDGGAPVWRETHNVTPDANGQYSIVLGSATAPGLPDDLFSQQEQRWLGVQVQGQAEQARVLLVSVPYAFKAHEAETLGGLPPSAFVKAPTQDATIGVSVSAVSTAGKTASTASSTRPPAAVGDCNFIGSGGTVAVGFIPLWISASPAFDELCDSVIFQTPLTAAGNVGVNTVAPIAGAKLDVNGNIATHAAPQAYQIGPQIVLSQPFGANVLVGFSACPNLSNPAGNHNTCIGNGAGLNTNTGTDNTFHGLSSGLGNTTGSFNDFSGVNSGLSNQSGNFNTFHGALAGINATANGNSFFGYKSGFSNTTGIQNVFMGFQSGLANTIGVSNVMIGYNAGQANIVTAENTFVGAGAGFNSTGGGVGKNTCLGYSACSKTRDGYRNTATGVDAGRSNTTGTFNAWFGDSAGFNLVNDTTGSQNTYLGTGAGSSISGALTDGSNNIFVGFAAGNAENNVNNNIEIGNTGPSPGQGCATPCSNQILIGTLGTHTDTYIQGIYGSVHPAPGRSVCIDALGKLYSILAGGTCLISSGRFKEQINDMGDTSSKLFELRPVTFFYKSEYDDGSHLLQYGLVAEQVAKVYPDLVVYEKDQPYTVKYEFLAPMLLNELQKQHTVVTAQQDAIKTQQEQMQAQAQQIHDLQQRLLRMESLLENK